MRGGAVALSAAHPDYRQSSRCLPYILSWHGARMGHSQFQGMGFPQWRQTRFSNVLPAIISDILSDICARLASIAS